MLCLDNEWPLRHTREWSFTFSQFSVSLYFYLETHNKTTSQGEDDSRRMNELARKNVALLKIIRHVKNKGFLIISSTIPMKQHSLKFKDNFPYGATTFSLIFTKRDISFR